jgi:hypothetical protein
MKINRIQEYILISIILIEAYLALVFLLFYPKDGEMPTFGISIAFMKTRDALLILGVLLILLRTTTMLRNPMNFIYIVVSIFNIAGFSFAIILYYLNIAALIWVHATLLNLLVASVMVVDLLIHTIGWPYPNKTIDQI